MDWTLAIERNTGALKRIAATLVAMAGLDATPTSPSTGLRGRSSDRASGSIVGREGRGDCGAIGAPGGAARSDAGGGGEAAHPTPALRADPPPQGEGAAFRPTLPRRLHRAILRLLRPAESAVRRLIVIAARGLVVPPSPPRVRKPAPPLIFLRKPGGTGIYLPPGTPLPGLPPRPAPRSISLPLFDPLKRPFRRHRPTPVCEPRISYPGPFNRLSRVKIHRTPTPEDRLDATRLSLRINALSAALADLPAQAHRLARWRANRDTATKFLAPATRGRGVERSETERGPSATPQAKTPRRYRRLSPLRPGRPPGISRRLDAEMRDLLTDLHGLAHDVLEHPDTS